MVENLKCLQYLYIKLEKELRESNSKVAWCFLKYMVIGRLIEAKLKGMTYDTKLRQLGTSSVIC